MVLGQDGTELCCGVGSWCCVWCFARMGKGIGTVGSVLPVWLWWYERDRVQKKTFTKWVNKHLIKAQRHVNDLYEDLRDGHNLISLLEVLSGDKLPREKGRMRFHKLQNVQIALNYLKHRQVKLVNIRNDDIADGNPKLTLGLIWTIILHFQISDIQVLGQSEDMTAKEKLLLWSQHMVQGYPGLRCENFTASWRDGRLFNAIIHRHKPMLIDMSRVYNQSNLENLEQAFSIAERDLGVTRLLDPEDVDVPQPDEKSIITYVSSLYDAMPQVPQVPQVPDGAMDLSVRWQLYYELVSSLLLWMRHKSLGFEERSLPGGYEEVELLWRQFLRFKESELPAKEADKNRSKVMFQSMEAAVHAGQLTVPPGYHPMDVEQEWAALNTAVMEREKRLRMECERLERLQSVVTKLQMESGLCEEQLNGADALLQSELRLLEGGRDPQKVLEVERDLDKADGMIRTLFGDVQCLKDGRHPQGEQMYRRVYRLHERLVSIRTEYNLRLKSGVPAPVVTAAPSDPALRYLQELRDWVSDNRRRVTTAGWGMDQPSIEALIGSHRGIDRDIRDFGAKVQRARGDEAQLPQSSRGAYREILKQLEQEYGELDLSRERLCLLESLWGLVSEVSSELLWLQRRQEEEVTFDWSQRGPDLGAKQEQYSALMQELELREKHIQQLQNQGQELMRQKHPAQDTIESFLAALRTQWTWLLQLCCCVETHLRENGAYHLPHTLYGAAPHSPWADPPSAPQELQEQLQDVGQQIQALSSRANTIVQLKPRADPQRDPLRLRAVCDYRQLQVTLLKQDTCTLLSKSQPHKWKVLINGAEAEVPSVCFTILPPNPEALEAVRRLAAEHQDLQQLWHRQHQELRSLQVWHSLNQSMEQILAWSPDTVKGDDADPSLWIQWECNGTSLTHPYGYNGSPLTPPMYVNGSPPVSPGEQDESRCQQLLSQLQELSRDLDQFETSTNQSLRLPMEQEPEAECEQRISQLQVRGGGIGRLALVVDEAQPVLALEQSPVSAPVLRSQLELTQQRMEQVLSLSSIYMEKLKTLQLVVHGTHRAEQLIQVYEQQLKDVQVVPSELPALEATQAELQRLQAEAESHQPLFTSLESDLGKAKDASERMLEGQAELERQRLRARQVLERWRWLLAQAELRHRDLQQLSLRLRRYRDSCARMRLWLQEARNRQEEIQELPVGEVTAAREVLRREKELLEECERHKEQVDECQLHAKQYIDAIKDYELQLVSFQAQVEPLASPAKKAKVQSASDSVIQEYVDLRTQYSELTTLTSQYIRFITDSLRRMEHEEMHVAQQAQLQQETQLLQHQFLTEKDELMQKEKLIEEEKLKLEKLFREEVAKAESLKLEQEQQQKEMEQERLHLKALLDEAMRQQREAEDNVRHKQEELQQLQRQRQHQEKLLEEENRRLRDRLEQMQEEYKAALAVVAVAQPHVHGVPNGKDVVDAIEHNGEPELAFDGIRQKVPAGKLVDAGVLSPESLEQLVKGLVSVAELAQRDELRRYLRGHSSIAGLVIKPTNERMSIYEAMKQKMLSPSLALVLLEAQAASGFIMDPVRNMRLSVSEAVREGIIGPELHHKMLAAERAVTGYKDPYTGDRISLFQAMQKGLIDKDHGIRLLEAQIATGGIIDPINSHRIPIEVAYERGYLDEEMNRILSDPNDDTKGFIDPNTQENLTYTQLMGRCVTDPETGLCLLPLTDQATKASEMLYTEQEAKDVFKKATVTPPVGTFQGRTVTIWEIINSEHFTEDQRRDLIHQYRTGRITVEKIIRIIITVVEEGERKTQMCFDGLRAPVPAAELLESKVITKDIYNELQKGKKTVKDVVEMEPVRQYLKGTGVIAGVLVESTGQKFTFYDALKRNLLKPEVAVAMLEAQAATGYIIDPVRNTLFSVDEAVKAEVVGPELHQKLLSAEKAVTGYKDPYTGQTVSLFQALKKGLIPGDTGVRLLDVQLSTGGIIDPVHSHRLPLDVAYKRGYFEPEMNEAMAELRDEAKGFYCPNTQEHLSYSQMQKSCRRDKQTGLYLLPLSDAAIQAQQEEVYSDSQAKECFTKTTVEVPVGTMKGQTMTIWELIHSEYFTEEHRRELLRQYKTGKVTIEKIIKIIITIIEEAEAKKQERLTFSGLRAPVPAGELVESNILTKTQYQQLKEGKKTVKDFSDTEAVRRFLHGSDCIAGVYVEATKEKLNLYEAMKRNLLQRGTAVVLLEAQAATGFLIDAVKNRKLYVNEAVKAGVVGPELHEKLLSAEKAVTGYKDPYSGNTISLFQAMQKGLIAKAHGVRLLEAQIATGGIIDPVHSHRLPIEVAYKRGYLDEEMNRTLSDPNDDTKGFIDPNTQENLTYTQLKEKCIEDPETGLYLLPLREAERPAVVEATQVYTEAETRKVFEETQVDIPVGSRAGSSMSLWEIMQSDLLPEEQRRQLMEEFRSGRVSKERMIIIIIEIIEKTEIIRQQNLTSYDHIRRRITAEELYEAKIITQDIYNLLKEGSKSFRELLEVETVWKYLYGSGCVAGIYLPSSKQKLSIYQALKKGLISSEVARSLLEAQAATGFMIDPIKNEMLTVDEAVRKGVVGPEIHDRLLSAERAVTGYRDPYSEQKISIFQAMKKELIPSEEALKLLDAQIATGGVIDPHLGFHIPLDVAIQRGLITRDTYDMMSEPSEVRSFLDPSTEDRLSYRQLLKRCHRDEGTGVLLLPLGDAPNLTFRGLRKQITVEELVRSQVMDEATARRLRDGLASVEEVTQHLKKFLEGTSCIAGVLVDSTKERLSVYQAMKKGIIRPGTAFELLEAQAATGYVIDPIKGLKLTVEEAVRMGIVGPEFKDKLLSAERAVTGYRDPYTGKLISLFQAMKKGLILKDHGIRLLEAQIATGGIIDPEESHRLPVEVAYKRGLFDEEMNEILSDPSDDTKGFFDPNTEENLTYLQLMDRCVTDPETGLCLLPLKEKKRERKTSSKSSVRKRRVVIVDPETGKEMSVYEAYRKGLIDHQTYLELSEQECEWEEITTSSSDGVVKSMIIDRRSGRQYDIDDAIGKGLIDQSALDQYRAGTLSITEFADMLSGNMSGFRSRSSSVGSSSSYGVSPTPVRTPVTMWTDPTEETGPVAGILDTDTLEKVSITEAMRRNLVDNITGQRLLEAQACTGGIIDPVTGDKCTVADAVTKGLVDKIMVDRINLAQKAFYGFEDPRTKTKMSAAQALKKGWLYYEAGQRFLEVQYLTGGLIEPDAAGRVSLDVALQKGTIDARTAQKLRDVNTYSKYLTCPKTKLKISYKDAMDRSMVEDGTGLRLLEASSQSSKGYYSPYNVSSAGSASGSRTGSRTGSRSGSRRGSFDATGSGFSMTFSSSSYSSSSFGRRYTVGATEAAVWCCGMDAGTEHTAVHRLPPPRVA
uniref:Uncharacterized protein n=1 Tax=Melopsittacus undulatus TaxID=13146 RepID=A0A8V5GLM5_MELUD